MQGLGLSQLAVSAFFCASALGPAPAERVVAAPSVAQVSVAQASVAPPSVAPPSVAQALAAEPRVAGGKAGLRKPLPIANYTLHATLNADTHQIRAKGTLTYTNPSRRPTKELFFHLYLNAFENEKTLFLRKRGGRNGARPGSPGWTHVTKLSSPAFGNTNLWEKAAAHSPGDPGDRTDIRVPLPRPLRGGETITLQLEFISQLPRVIERTGYEGDFHLVAQWYPKLAKREDNGTWAHFAFHPYSEFYADFGNYDVTLDVPASHQVGSTGRLEELSSVDRERKIYRAEAKGVHDFAWVSGPHLLKEQHEIFGVPVTLLIPPDSLHVRSLTLSTLERSLPYLSGHFGPYPYSTLTVVHPPESAQRAGGMEYPSFITTGGSEFGARTGVRMIEMMNVHELGHQWFQSAVASNEERWPFLDEGLTSFAETRYLEETYGDSSLADLPWIKVSRMVSHRVQQGPHARRQAIGTSAPDFKSFGALGTIIYARTPLVLETLRRTSPPGAFDRALLDYALKFRFRHPSPEDLFEVLELHLGNKARENAEKMILNNGFIDLRVENVATQKVPQGYSSQISIGRLGDLELPFLVRVGFVDGSHQDRVFDGKRAEDWTLSHETPLTDVTVDPERRIYIDENFLNNHVYAPGQKPLTRAQLPAISLASLALLLGAL